jgi:hypothetical protein
MLKLLHTADWQIGRQYGRFDPEDAAALAEARFTAVERIAALAASERVDAVLVAGDVFDAQTVSAKTIRRLFNATAGYTGPWLMIPATTTPRSARVCGRRPGAWAPSRRTCACR